METLSIGQIYATLGIVLIILEVVVPGFVMLPIGVGFLITSAFVGLIPSVGGQLLLLFLSIILTFIFFSKVIKFKLQKARHLSNAESLVGQMGIVEEEINANSRKGYVKIYGDSWKAIAVDGSVINVGSRVVVEKLDGNKIIVRAI